MTGTNSANSPASAADCRRFARECLNFAKELHDPTSKMALISMAAAWKALAEAKEKGESPQPYQG